MGALRLNTDQILDWKNIARLSLDDLSKFNDALNEHKNPIIVASNLVKCGAASIPDHEIAKALVRQLLSLCSAQRSIQFTGEQILADVFANFESEEEQETLDALNTIKRPILSLLEDRSFVLSAKALHLSFDQDKLLVSSNVITDIRPVFDDAREKILGGVILLSIRLEFIVNGERQSVCVSVDENDVSMLAEQLKTGLRKAAAAKLLFLKEIKKDAFIVGEETYGF